MARAAETGTFEGTAAPAAGVDGSSVDIKAVFDGWGYIHLFDAQTFADLDQFAIQESQDPRLPQGSATSRSTRWGPTPTRT